MAAWRKSPPATLLHLGPGLANGLANLHNARRAATPIVNIVGDHATYHAQYDAPLASDIAGFARPVSAWVHSSASALTVAADGARAVEAARGRPGQIATLILPADTAWNDAEARPGRCRSPAPAPVADRPSIEAVARRCSTGKRTRDPDARAPRCKRAGWRPPDASRRARGARLLCDTFAPRLRAAPGVVAVERIPYFAEQIVEIPARTWNRLILVGAKPPVSFFAYPGKPSWCLPDGCRILYLAQPHEDGVGALDALAEASGAPDAPAERARAADAPMPPKGRLNDYTVGPGDRAVSARERDHFRRSARRRARVRTCSPRRRRRRMTICR